MNKRIKLALFALGSGMVALQSASCFARFLGDTLADAIAFLNID